MAGDWIKLEHATLDKPEVLRTADLLGIHRREALGLFAEFWIWLDKNLSASCPDFVRNMSRKSLDEVLHTPGFASVLEAIGWAEFDDSRAVMRITNAERHNGTPAKTRALDAKRKKEKRLENVRGMSGSEPDKPGTREEKRREDKKIRGADALQVEALVADGLTPETANEFLTLRRAKGAKLTPKAWGGIKAEAAKAGWPIERAICKSLSRGWQSFEADWVANEKTSAAEPAWKGAK